MVKFHTSKDTTWTNAAGDPVPVKYVPNTDKHKEKLAAAIYKEALRTEEQLKGLHTLVSSATAEVTRLVKDEFDIKKKKQFKGNITWYNFDKSFKLEANVNDVVRWDDALMTEAKVLLNDYISSSLGETNELIRSLVNEAFSSSKGTIDSRKVFQILKYEEKIRNAKFQKACALIKQAQAIDKTKLYMRVWVKDDKGEYRNINLNFSAI